MNELAIKTRPILFSTPMVKALLEGRKTQTRRIVRKPKAIIGTPSDGTWDDDDVEIANTSEGYAAECRDERGDGYDLMLKCPYGKPGDRLWVKETHRLVAWDEEAEMLVQYQSDNAKEWCYFDGESHDEYMDSWERKNRKYCTEENEKLYPDLDRLPWVSSLFMPRWASRITLEITDVRVQRVKDISEEDAKAEGVATNNLGQFLPPYPSAAGFTTAKRAYAELWDSINGAGSWDSNPWVWALTFKRVKP